MAPIPVHSTSPISPTAGLPADGMTANTSTTDQQSPGSGEGQIAATTPATSTGPALLRPLYAQPGAPAVPAPTSPARPNATRYTPTGTVPAPSTPALSSPPPPQPGAVPLPLQPHLAPRDPGPASVPSPPTAGEIPKPASHDAPQYDSPATTTPTIPSSGAPPPLPYHLQNPNLSTPLRAQPPASMTSTPHDLSHPPGYVQNSRASFEERPIEPYRPFGNGSNQNRTLGRSGAGILDERSENQAAVEGEEKSLWGEAVSWAKTVGGKVIEGEEALWKRINSQR